MISGCPFLVGTEYSLRQNEVAKILQTNLCEKYGKKACERAWKHQPKVVIETKVNCVGNLRTDRLSLAQKPDTVVVIKVQQDSSCHRWLLYYVTNI